MNLQDYGCRPMTEDDLRMVLDWRNSSYVHERMLTEHKITWEEHTAWFARIKGENPSEHLIFTRRDEPIGYIAYFGHEPTERRCSFGIYLGQPSTNPWDGICLYTTAVNYAFEHLDVNVLQAETLVDNEPSISLAHFLGVKDVRIEKDGCMKQGVAHDVQIGQLRREEWEEYRKMRGL